MTASIFRKRIRTKILDVVSHAEKPLSVREIAQRTAEDPWAVREILWDLARESQVDIDKNWKIVRHIACPSTPTKNPM